MNNTLPQIVNDWKPETRSLLRSLQEAGFKINLTDNGEERMKVTEATTEDKIIEELTACDESHLYIEKDGSRTALFLVYGNSPGELVCDYGIPKDETVAALLDKVTRDHNEKWEGRKQPTTTR